MHAVRHLDVEALPKFSLRTSFLSPTLLASRSILAQAEFARTSAISASEIVTGFAESELALVFFIMTITTALAANLHLHR
jgi:hypothetical protein